MKPVKEGYRELYELSTGKAFSANLHIVGISPDLAVSEGYDGELPDSLLTPGEKVELADYMIAQWVRYRSKWAIGGKQ